MSDPSQTPLLDLIAKDELRLTELEEERKEILQRLSELRGRLHGEREASLSLTSTESIGRAEPWGTKAKLDLFMSLFRGRSDVFPKRWASSKTGRSGYSPACGNEWAPGLCDKPRVKCGECKQQAFTPLTDKVLVDHFRGRIVAGIYPLLPDETCFFLAIDFDKGTWQEDVQAFWDTCDREQVPVAIERSRSGEGAHAWFFFQSAVPASLARKLGCWLITQTMSHRPELSLSSYDRLFPSQDTMPRGGFGNLIALPFQRMFQ